MGVMRAAAARLGLRLAGASTVKKKISSSSSWLSVFTRRSPSTSLDLEAATTTDDDVDNKKSGSGSEEESKNEKKMYLCFYEWSENAYVNHVLQVVRPIRLDAAAAYDDDDKEEDLVELVYNSSDVKRIYHRCLSLGSQILFCIGCSGPKRICWIDTSTTPLNFQVSSTRSTKIKSFSRNKSDMILGVVDRKLYILNSDIYSRGIVHDFFEVLDPENDDSNAMWQPLDRPPFIRDRVFDNYSAIFLNGSKKILGWEYKKPVVFCFDTTKPENGWKESPPSLGETIPFIPLRKALIIHDHHPDLGDFNLIFTYNPKKEPFIVFPFFMSDNCDSFQSINTPIPLPGLCSNYLPSKDESCHYKVMIYVFEFVHLGARKFGLVFHKFINSHPDPCIRKGIILLIEFEYDIVSTSNNNTLEIKTRLLGTRRFRYCPTMLPGTDYTFTREAYMTGAFFV